MSEMAISIQHVSKKFRLFASPQERLKEALHPFKKKYHKEFWALKDISFEVKKGTTLGIIGRNGAGKSTLLHILCSIIRPTSGTVTVSGRVSALLALGAGFNAEFTGRQNAIMNGVLMGLTTEEMNKRLPEIAAFADIGEFIDQPMKIYSSGMSLRLAFAAAIHVDPDILIVDEAIAVGDAKFQNKCYNKFLEFQRGGKTVLFVTHDMHAITRHCDSAVLLENGTVSASGDPNNVVNRYYKSILVDDSPSDAKTVVESSASLESMATSSEKCGVTELERFLGEVPVANNCIRRKSYNRNEYRFGDRRAEFVDYLAVCGETYDPAMVNSGDMLEVYLKAKSYDDIESPLIGYEVKTVDGVYLYATNTSLTGIEFLPIQKFDVVIFKFTLVLSNLKPGDYFISFGLCEKQSGKNGSQYNMIDSRNDIIHLLIAGKNNFDGLVGLDTTCNEISRRNVKSATLNENKEK